METTTHDAIRHDLNARKAMGESGEIVRSEVIARAMLDQDLGYHSDSLRHDYGLDEATRDRLIAHARQDAANAQGNALAAYKAAISAKRVALALGLINAGLLTWVLVRLG
ncbi:hypothetical protein GCM10008171_19720 [Methylopila jiangsuensis]|uniref:Uncharacterized protein n=1 Tax=Methylopila jiangsuensis TaxID=586230 RepID=A0A9W6JJJ6_9HYPH|nr:hypothetical protein [Methylopila jiangsuensis]MDR6286932.1 hypothetical protein [Methylopila jiangsuensis]GLK76718.1 hypothetical protein GCM10008171_19720 [Methylopila jiangsuensis]